MQLLALPSSLLACLSFILLPTKVLADVQFVLPAAGSNVEAGTISVEWRESGVAPPITNLAAYTLTLMTGGNEDEEMLALSVFMSQGYFTSGNNASGTIPSGIAEDVKNGFFFRIISSSSVGGEVINYSDRFSISSLTGVTPAKYLNAATALDGSTDGPGSVGDAASSSTTALSTGASTSAPTSTGPVRSRTVTVTNGPTSSSTTTPDTRRPQSDDSGISTGALAGIAIAGAAIGILGIAVALWVCLRRRRVREVSEIKLGSEDGNHSDHRLRREMSMATPSPPPVELDPSSSIVEAGDGMRPPEMDSMNIRAELEGDYLHEERWDEPLTPIPDTPLENLTLDSSMIPTLMMPGVQPRDNV